MSPPSPSTLTRGKHRLLAMAAGLLATFAALPVAAAIDVAQRPLFLGASVPGHLALVPSVEFPTVISVANIGSYSNATTVRWVGYFDSNKCYRYRWSAVESERHFFPSSWTANHQCAGADEWSGHFLNWATTQTIDPFRMALTGGLRVRDTPTETWLQKARMDRPSTANFPRRNISGGLVGPATPASWTNFNMRIDALGHRMWFTGTGDVGINPNNAGLVAANVVAFNPALHVLNNNDYQRNEASGLQLPPPTADRDERNRNNVVYEVSVRVAVCVPGFLEPNCVQYAHGWKPEGLIQEFAGRGNVGPQARPRLFFSMFGYTNISNNRDGGVMRANAKYVGPLTIDATGAAVPNPAAEWDPVTGVLHRNPNPADATATNAALGLTAAPNLIQHSGVINYLNLFGEVATRRLLKSFDPVSELYYTALRYLKHQGPVPEYSANLGATPAERFDAADGFPVITTWNDPIAFRCQANVLLGIGDVNTWHDKNLPGPTATTSEPAKPAAVTADTTVDVVRFMGLINQLQAAQGHALPGAAVSSWSGRDNSAYIAALAYHANTQDLRPGMLGMQTAQTFWVDVLEFQNLHGRRSNQYWLAAKYGGFQVPSGFDPLTRTAPLPPALWHRSGETITVNAGPDNTVATRIQPRPDNYFPARDAEGMVRGLRRAFENIVAAVEGAGVSFATNTTRLEAGARVFQASFFSGTWRGELDAYNVDPTTGLLSSTPIWSASAMVPAWGSRDLWVNSNGFRRFDDFNALAAADRTALGSVQRMNYLRGDRSNEAPNGAQFRARQSVLGTFVNSQPVFVGRPSPLQFRNASFAGTASYAAFATTWNARTPSIWLGSNGGKLHAFNANTGVEEFAFLPNGVLRNQIAGWADPAYTHRYQVDGDPVVADVFDTALNRWRTILVSTMGRGGRSVFALDITDPANVQFLWERSEAEIPALGNALNRPIIGQVADGDWRVFLGNGINGSGSAELVMIRAVGAGAGSHEVVRAVADSNNGLTGVAVLDEDGDAIADAVYGGDYEGNVWVFDNLATTPGASRVFTARAPDNTLQPITASPRVAINPADNSVWVFFGTGSYLNENDLGNAAVQTWYGLRVLPEGTAITGRSELHPVPIILEGTIVGRDARVIEAVPAAAVAAPRRGWYIDLVPLSGVPAGERMVESNQFQGQTLIGVTRIPDATDVCAPGGRGFVMAIDPFTGGRRANPFFDVNRDNVINHGDSLGGLPVSGVGFASAPNTPTFLGRVMQVSLDDRSRETILTDAGAGQPRRSAWREVIVE